MTGSGDQPVEKADGVVVGLAERGGQAADGPVEGVGLGQLGVKPRLPQPFGEPGRTGPAIRAVGRLHPDAGEPHRGFPVRPVTRVVARILAVDFVQRHGSHAGRSPRPQRVNHRI